MIESVQKSLFSGPEINSNWPFGALEPLAYDVIMIDPPWRFANWSDKGEAKGPEPHYRTMSDEQIRRLRVGDLASKSCMLWLWATWPKADLAIECLKLWGFTFKTGGAWNKKRWGTGYVWRSVCEPVFIGTIGDPRITGASVPNLFSESRREHSAKPEIAYDLAEQMMPLAARRADVFSRRSRPGWEASGDEIGKFDRGTAQ